MGHSYVDVWHNMTRHTSDYGHSRLTNWIMITHELNHDHSSHEWVRSEVTNMNDAGSETWVMNCRTLQHTATYCNIMQHTAAHCNTLTWVMMSRRETWAIYKLVCDVTCLVARVITFESDIHELCRSWDMSHYSQKWQTWTMQFVRHEWSWFSSWDMSDDVQERE